MCVGRRGKSRVLKEHWNGVGGSYKIKNHLGRCYSILEKEDPDLDVGCSMVLEMEGGGWKEGLWAGFGAEWSLGMIWS